MIPIGQLRPRTLLTYTYHEYRASERGETGWPTGWEGGTAGAGWMIKGMDDPGY